MSTRDGLDVIDELIGTEDERRDRGNFAKVSICLTDSFLCSHVLRSPAVRISYRHISITDSVDETFQLEPIRFSESAFILQVKVEPTG